MTYNAHGCFGTDKKLSPFRIAKVLSHYKPDIIALQELDVKRVRSGIVDQPRVIARDLRMYFHFCPSLEVKEEKYGNAILSRFDMEVKRAGPLPTLPSRTNLEQRSALWTKINVDGKGLNVINTHLGLNRSERLAQVNALLGPDWLGGPECSAPLILCGDFNSSPFSAVYNEFGSRFRDAQFFSPETRPRKTFPSFFPFLRLDHIFLSGEIEVHKIEAPRTLLTMRSSDHLPLIAEVSF